MLKAYLTSIADKIRVMCGTTEKINAQDFVEGIENVHEHGYEEGLVTGEQAGREAENILLWHSIQLGGNRDEYSYFFLNWPAATFYPKYDIKLAHTTIHGTYGNIGVFRSFNSGGTADFDMSARLEECGVTIVGTGALKSFQYFIMSSNVKRIPPIDLSSAVNTYMAFYASKVQVIDGLVFSEATVPNANMFAYCSNLKTITEVEGTIAKSISFSYSPLDVPTMNRIIACLKDYSSTGGTYTLTLKKDRETMLTDEEKAVATSKGWTLVWS